VAQGVGQALMESIVFDDDGQLVTGSFQDYAMPRAEDFPDLLSELTEVPATTNPLGVKGAGEAGATAKAKGDDPFADLESLEAEMARLLGRGG